jgi:hypothetical protein
MSRVKGAWEFRQLEVPNTETLQFVVTLEENLPIYSGGQPWGEKPLHLGITRDVVWIFWVK